MPSSSLGMSRIVRVIGPLLARGLQRLAIWTCSGCCTKTLHGEFKSPDSRVILLGRGLGKVKKSAGRFL